MKHITMQEFFASIPEVNSILDLFEKGIEMRNERLAISALEELIRREAGEAIIEELDWSFNERCGHLLHRPSIISLMGSTLRDSCRGLDPLLCHYGKSLLSGEYVGPTEWIKTHADDFRTSPAAKNARPWAKPYLEAAAAEHRDRPFAGIDVSPFDNATLIRAELERAAATKQRCDAIVAESFCDWVNETIADHTLPGNDR